MKKLLGVLKYVLAIVFILFGAVFLYLTCSDVPSYDIEPVSFKSTSTPAAIARGQKLTAMLCANCHMNAETGKLSGKQMLDAPPEFGVIYAPNITQDRTHGIGEWSDAEILYLLRTGIKRDGQYAPPYMAKLPNMADEDINAIIAFLRSDHASVSPDPTPDKPCEPSLLTKALCRVAFKPFSMPENKIPMPDTNNLGELGKYLTINLDCFSCHSRDFKTNNYLNPEESVGYCSGGNSPLDNQGRVVMTSNLTPDKETGIGSWTKEEFSQAVRFGLKKGEPALQYPMMPYNQLTEHEVDAIYTYLMSIPAIENRVERKVYD